MPDRPNILFIFPDQLSARWLPCYGSTVVQAPNLDRFVAESVQFDRAYTNSPLCTPYRACLLTGKYPSQTGVTENAMRLPEGETTLAHRLTEAGYSTHYIGKWHLSGDPQGNRWVPPEQRGGFQHFIGWESHHVDHYQGLIWEDDPEQVIHLRGHETDGLTDIVCRELAALADTDNPFFMTVSYQAPHAPSSPPDGDYARYGSEVMAEPPNTTPDAWFRAPNWGADYGVEEFRKRYFGEISQLDAAFGRVLATLADSGLAENTIVFFTSDHGDMGGCHNLFGKGVVFDEAVRVPLLVRLPGGPGGCRTALPVGTVDLFSTILDLAGIQPNGLGAGRSFAQELSSPGSLPERDVFVEYHGDCIIRGDLKLVTEHGSDQVTHCFDLSRDPYELDNQASAPDASPRDDLLAALNQWRETARG